jgi:bifunctional non-homologous end joining protein LigD
MPKTRSVYVIHKHADSHLHYDFRLELNGVLKSWILPKGPSLNPKNKRLAIAVEDHALDYANFEGIIPAGYGAGTVMLWDKGYWESALPTLAAYKKGQLIIKLEGTKLKGLWKLTLQDKSLKHWLLIKLLDEFAAENQDEALLATPSVHSALFE